MDQFAPLSREERAPVRSLDSCSFPSKEVLSEQLGEEGRALVREFRESVGSQLEQMSPGSSVETLKVLFDNSGTVFQQLVHTAEEDGLQRHLLVDVGAVLMDHLPGLELPDDRYREPRPPEQFEAEVRLVVVSNTDAGDAVEHRIAPLFSDRALEELARHTVKAFERNYGENVSEPFSFGAEQVLRFVEAGFQDWADRRGLDTDEVAFVRSNGYPRVLGASVSPTREEGFTLSVATQMGPRDLDDALNSPAEGHTLRVSFIVDKVTGILRASCR
jgi:hypothetical protein